MEDVAGLGSAKQELQEIIDYLKDPDRFLKMGGKLPKGILLVGPPGTGKTLMARAVAGEAEVPFFSISGSEFIEMFVGVGASRVRDMFDNAKKDSPAIIFIDELDSIGRARGTGLGGGHDETGADPESDPLRDGRLHRQGIGDRAGRHQPSGRAGPGLDPAGTFRSADHPGPAPAERPRRRS